MGAKSTSVTDRLVETLQGLGVDVVFGLPGTQNIDLYDSLRRSGIRPVLTTSEIAAGFMAIGYYRGSGRPGVFAAIEGPGFAWSVAPLSEAAMDASSVILITGSSSANAQPYDLGSIRQDRIARAVGAAVFDLDDPESVRDTVKRAWAEAQEPGPQPVVIQVTARLATKSPPAAGSSSERGQNETADRRVLADVWSELRQAQRPIILAGAGCIEPADKLRTLIDAAGIPCLTTPAARGVVDESHHLCLGRDLFFADVSVVNALMARADLIVVLGSRLARNSTSGFRLKLDTAKLIHVGPHAGTASETYPARLTVRAKVAEFLDVVSHRLTETETPPCNSWERAEIAEWRHRMEAGQGALPSRPQWQGHGDCSVLFEAIREGVPADGLVVTDTGLHQLMTRALFEVQVPGGLIFPSDFQSMGFGLPAAIGAALANRNRPVAAMVGDGSFRMVGAELLTAKREKIGLPVLVFCDNSLGLIRDQQIHSSGHEIATALQETRLAEYAKWLGVQHVVADSGLAGQIRACFGSTGPTIIEVRLDEDPALKRLRRRVRWRSSMQSIVQSEWITGRMKKGV
ncbi:thiamine pyrophosphate-binding protein [Lentisalinibacter orientalis]|uniref:thiamine pyrophosphate-binding protein n=1 Tax=Lentisalinibacter orientalis TaxID=2992241 RepID=UPI003867D1F8